MCAVWWLEEDGEDKHDKLAVQLGLSGRCFRGASPIALFCDTPLSRPEPECVKAHLCGSDLEPCSRCGCIPGKEGKKREQEEKKKVKRNSPWYSLKFSSTATPPSLRSSSLPSLALSLFPPSVPTAIVSPCCLPARLPGLSMIVLMNS